MNTKEQFIERIKLYEREIKTMEEREDFNLGDEERR